MKCRDQDFHSGTFGGILNEPMADLVALLGSNAFCTKENSVLFSLVSGSSLENFIVIVKLYA